MRSQSAFRRLALSRLWGVVGLCVAVVLPGGAWAGDSDDEPEGEGAEDEIVVEAPRPSTAPTAVRHLIDLDFLRARYATAAEQLDLVAGVDVRDFGGAGQPRLVQLRGAAPEQVVVIVDGVRINPILGGGADLALVSLEGSRAVEVLRGPAAAAYGADAMGGVIRFLPDPRYASRVSVTGGSFETVRAAARHRLELGEDGGLELVASVDRTRGNFHFLDSQRSVTGTRDNNDALIGSTRVGLDGPLANGRASLRVSATALRAGSPGYVEYPTPSASRASSQAWIQGQWTRGLGSGELMISANERVEQNRYENPDALLGGGGLRTEHVAQGSGASAGWSGVAAPWLALRVGADGRWERLLAGPYGRPSRWIGAASAGATASWPRVDVVASVRAEWAERAGAAWLPTAGVRVDLGGGAAVRANVGRVWRLPSFLELYHPDEELITGNPDLAPERGVAADAGLSWAHEPLRAEVVVFRQDVAETILWAPVTAFRYQPTNTGPVRMGGVETSVWWDGTWGGFGLAHTHLETRRLQTGEPLPGRPEERVALTGRGGWRWISAFGELTWTSSSYADFHSNLSVPGGGNVAAGFSLGPWRHLTWTVEGKNLLDADLRDSRYYPLPSRAVYVTALWER